jgi:phytanoyl-CoA hydroxylase
MLVAPAQKENYRQAFAKEGFFILRQVFSPEQIAVMREGLEAIVRGEAAKTGRRFQPDTDSGNYGDLEKIEVGYRGPNIVYRKISDLEYDSIFLRCLQSPKIKKICQELMGDTVSLLRVTMMSKQAKGGTPLPWHQDVAQNWPTDVQPQLAIWFPLDSATEASGSLQVIPGSHAHGMIDQGHMLAADMETRYAPANKIVTAELEPGDCLFFHAALLHRSGINTSDAQRRAVNAVLIPGAALHTKRNKPYPVLFGVGQLQPSKVARLKAIPK